MTLWSSFDTYDLHCIESQTDTQDFFFVAGSSTQWTINSHDEVNRTSLFGYDAPKKENLFYLKTKDCDIEFKLYLLRFSVDSW